MAIRKIVTRSVQDDTLLAVDMNGSAFGNTSMPLPIGTTAERPTPGNDAHIRYNTTLGETEIYKNSNWGSFIDVGYHALKIDNTTGFLVHERYSSTDGTVSMADLDNSHSSFFGKSSMTFDIDSSGNLTVTY
jgi:hypothetical protein